jgi:outer membrane immunogenic protein
MKKLLLAGAALAALGITSASAADLSMPTKAPPAYYQPQGYNWTGFYLGINGGGGIGRSDYSGSNFGGASPNISGAVAGGTIGYNWQINQTVLGLEGDFDWSGIRGDTSCGGGFSCETRNDWLATARGRLGYTFDRFMPYVTGGAAFGNVKTRIAGTGLDNEDTRVGWTAGGGVEGVLSGAWTMKVEYLYVDLGNTDVGLGTNADFKTHLVRAGLNYRF